MASYMLRRIVEQNVQHFQELLQDEANQQRRKSLKCLIQDEKAKLSQPLEDYWA